LEQQQQQKGEGDIAGQQEQDYLDAVFQVGRYAQEYIPADSGRARAPLPEDGLEGLGNGYEVMEFPWGEAWVEVPSDVWSSLELVQEELWDEMQEPPAVLLECNDFICGC